MAHPEPNRQSLAANSSTPRRNPRSSRQLNKVLQPKTLSLSLEEFLVAVIISLSQLTLEQLKELVTRLELNSSLLHKLFLFKPTRYYWKYILKNDELEVLICCWLPGQKSGEHLHRGGALNVTKVLMGSIVHERYAANDSGEIEKYCEEVLGENELTWVDRSEWHQLANYSTEKSVTLHFYTPSRPA